MSAALSRSTQKFARSFWFRVLTFSCGPMDRITRDKCCDAKNSCAFFAHDCLNCGPMGRIAKDKCCDAKNSCTFFLFMDVLAAVQWTAQLRISVGLQNLMLCFCSWLS